VPESKGLRGARAEQVELVTRVPADHRGVEIAAEAVIRQPAVGHGLTLDGFSAQRIDTLRAADGLEIDDQLELGRLLDGKVGGLGALEDLVDIGGGPPIDGREIRSPRAAPSVSGGILVHHRGPRR
jgi:hypothetical protein